LGAVDFADHAGTMPHTIALNDKWNSRQSAEARKSEQLKIVNRFAGERKFQSFVDLFPTKQQDQAEFLLCDKLSSLSIFPTHL